MPETNEIPITALPTPEYTPGDQVHKKWQPTAPAGTVIKIEFHPICHEWYYRVEFTTCIGWFMASELIPADVSRETISEKETK